MRGTEGVHQTHCCVHHGCKYGDEDCPVEQRQVVQEYPCEMCREQIEEDKEAGWQEVGKLAVDSGRCVLIDPAYVKYAQEAEEAVHDQIMADGGYDYVTEVKVGILTTGGVIVQTGLGDGLYPIEVRMVDDPDWGRRVAEMRVRFMPHPYFQLETERPFSGLDPKE